MKDKVKNMGELTDAANRYAGLDKTRDTSDGEEEATMQRARRMGARTTIKTVPITATTTKGRVKRQAPDL